MRKPCSNSEGASLGKRGCQEGQQIQQARPSCAKSNNHAAIFVGPRSGIDAHLTGAALKRSAGHDINPHLKKHAPAILAFILSAFMIFAGLGRPSLMHPDEERNAEVAREMWQAGAWLIPTYDYLPYLDKPSFFFKTVGLSFSLFGESSTAARLPSAVFGFALVVMLFCFCRCAYDARSAVATVLVVGTSPLYVAFCRLVIFDMILSFFLCGAILAGYIAEEKEGRSRSHWYLLGAASSAIATLIKGPVGFILPLLVLSVFHWLDRCRGAWKRVLAPWNVVIFFAITLPWFLGVTYQYRDFAYYGIIEESFHRYTTAVFRRTGPIYYYIPWILGGCFAWSLLLPESTIAAWRSRSRWTRPDRLFIVWSVIAFLFFTVSRSKRPDYILTVVVALGALTARVFSLALDSDHRRATATVMRGTTGLAWVGTLMASLLLTAHGIAELLGHLAGTTREGTRWLEKTVYSPAICVLIIVTTLAIVARRRRDVRLALVAFVLLPIGTAAVMGDGLERYADMRSTQALANRIPPLPPQTEVACFECLPTGLPLYLKRSVTVITNDGKELSSNYLLFMLRKTRSWPSPLVPVSGLDRWLDARHRPIYLIIRANGHEATNTVVSRGGGAPTELAPGWWGALLPAPTGP
jgi:4-amino-4-deoxy-L-arabinose transferase-like glycosyltransferase